MSRKRTSIEYLKGVGPERARLLNEELKISTFEQLLQFFQTDILTELNFIGQMNYQKIIQKFN